MQNDQIVIYKTKNGEAVITKLINMIFKEKEPEEKCNVQKMHIANSPLSLDIINTISNEQE